MNTSRAFALATLALVVGFLTARWCYAQPSNQPSKKGPESYDFGALQKYESFAAYLQDAKQTNILQQFNDYSNASLASQFGADLGMKLLVLQKLRDGHTDKAYQMLECSLDTDIVGFVTSYRQLPASAREQENLKVLKMAKDYRAQYPFSFNDPIADEALTNAFKLLDEKSGSN